MANGETKPISEVEIGDEVLATDPDTGETTAREVTAVWVSAHDGDLLDVTITGADGTTGVVETTDGHKFWSVTVEGWVEAQHLTDGEQLRQPDGTTATVTGVDERDGRQDMHDLTVDIDHTFYVTYRADGDGAVLVHNCGGWHRGDDIWAKTAAGNDPSWSTVRFRYWKNAADAPGAAERYGAENVERMRQGLAPQRANPNAPGGRESMELSHEPVPARDGGRNLAERWPCEHAAVDPYRNPGYC